MCLREKLQEIERIADVQQCVREIAIRGSASARERDD
uniref:Uncharacterized protein n=1 Tax=Nelumbo nucifera TaxID=4432 RepID=A0A822ZIQ6_NELNU|nr:TPA_asm: hypothetical protein HUJ06_001585 [Nelumbo nucifera]